MCDGTSQIMEKEIYTALKENGFSFKKQFGQNFITDKNLLNSIVSLAGVEERDTVLEIGCGAGTLTRALSERARRVISFEIDKSLQPVLARTLSGLENVEVVFRDFMREDIGKFEEEVGGFKVVANLPYYLTTPLITKILERSKLCQSLTVMVQEEVADRLCARENTPEYGAVTAAVALRARAEKVKRVPRENFFPVPDVDSAVVKLTIEDGRLPVRNADTYRKTVRAAFLSRRKTLVNNLMAAFDFTRARAEAAVAEAGADLKARGETLSPEKFAKLSNVIYNMINQ